MLKPASHLLGKDVFQVLFIRNTQKLQVFIKNKENNQLVYFLKMEKQKVIPINFYNQHTSSMIQDSSTHTEIEPLNILCLRQKLRKLAVIAS